LRLHSTTYHAKAHLSANCYTGLAGISDCHESLTAVRRGRVISNLDRSVAHEGAYALGSGRKRRVLAHAKWEVQSPVRVPSVFFRKTFWRLSAGLAADLACILSCRLAGGQALVFAEGGSLRFLFEHKGENYAPVLIV
jgi:hypothetical protein